MPVCACGFVSDAEARFCRDCGGALGNNGPTVLVLDGGEDQSSESVVRRGRSQPQTWSIIAAFGVVAVVVWGVWAALAAPPTGITEPGSRDEAPASTGGTAPEATNDDAGEADAERDTGSTGSGAGPAAETTSPQPAAGPEGGAPVLGREVDYDLLISTSGRPAMLDLDSGVVSYTEGSPVVPVAVSGAWLAVEGPPSSGATSRLPLNDLGADPVRLLAEQETAYTTVLPTIGRGVPGQLWIIVYLDDVDTRPFLYLVDLSSGASVDHPLAGEIDTSDLLEGMFADGDGGIVTGPAGGIYTTTGDGFQQVAEGRLLAADRSRALVESCDTALRCESAWLDRRTWRPLDLAVPTGPDLFLVMVHGTDWMLVGDLRDLSSGSLLDIMTGQTVEVSLPEMNSSLVLPAVSPDGRWLAEPAGDPQTVVLRDLATGDTTEVTLDEPTTSQLFFVEE